jgi:hypothetical protein
MEKVNWIELDQDKVQWYDFSMYYGTYGSHYSRKFHNYLNNCTLLKKSPVSYNLII